MRLRFSQSTCQHNHTSGLALRLGHHALVLKAMHIAMICPGATRMDESTHSVGSIICCQ